MAAGAVNDGGSKSSMNIGVGAGADSIGVATYSFVGVRSTMML